MSTRTDAELLADAAGVPGDPAAFRELYDRYAARVHAFLSRSTGDREAAYDLTAETFAQAWLSRARFRDQANGSAGPWLFAIARNKLLISVRRAAIEARARERLGLLSTPAAGTPAAGTPAAGTPAAGTPAAGTPAAGSAPTAGDPDPAWIDGLEQALAELPPAQREALRLRIEEDLDYEHVAAALGTSPEAARVRVHRAIARLRRRLPNPKETLS
jgi:RNA polymerase sigma-70 factor, ECF subfamily